MSGLYFHLLSFRRVGQEALPAERKKWGLRRERKCEVGTCDLRCLGVRRTHEIQLTVHFKHSHCPRLSVLHAHVRGPQRYVLIGLVSWLQRGKVKEQGTRRKILGKGFSILYETNKRWQWELARESRSKGPRVLEIPLRPKDWIKGERAEGNHCHWMVGKEKWAFPLVDNDDVWPQKYPKWEERLVETVKKLGHHGYRHIKNSCGCFIQQHWKSRASSARLQS